MNLDDLAAKLDVIEISIEKLKRHVGVYEADWEPLINFLVSDFMSMGCHDGFHLYKHRYTRRYLQLDSDGNTYWFNKDHYEPLPIEEAIALAFDGLNELWHPSRPNGWPPKSGAVFQPVPSPPRMRKTRRDLGSSR